MELAITGRKTTVTPALRDYVNEKIGTAVRVYAQDSMSGEVILRVEKNHAISKPNICEVTIHTKGAVIRVSEAEIDMYAAIDLAADRVSRQLRKYKTKVVDRRHRGAGDAVPIFTTSIAREGQPLTPEQMDALLQTPVEEEMADDDLLVREKIIDFSMMSEEEALVQTDLLGHDFFVFTNDKTGLTNVVYHRHNGGYGILKPRIESEEG